MEITATIPSVGSTWLLYTAGWQLRGSCTTQDRRYVALVRRRVAGTWLLYDAGWPVRGSCATQGGRYVALVHCGVASV